MLLKLSKQSFRRFKKIGLIFLVLYVMIGAALYFLQEKLLFFPTPLNQDYHYQFHYNFEEVFLPVDKDAMINALYFKVGNPKGVILYFHGNAGNLSGWGSVAEYFVAQQYNVFIMDYRTYGKSTGMLSEAGFYRDAQSCYEYLLKDYSENEITIYGRSLGTGVASFIASNNHPKQLVLESPYYSILDVAKSRFPIFPIQRILKYNFPTYRFLQNTSCPISIIHGKDDVIVPYSSGEKLSKLPIDTLDFIAVDGAGHNDLIEFDDYHKAIQTILK